MFNKKYLCLVCVLGLFLFSGWGDLSNAINETNDVTPGSNTGAAGFYPRVGEILEYRVWVKSFILGGKQTFKIAAQDVIQDRAVLKVQFELKTIGLAWQLTKYSEKEDLTLDRNGLYPLMIRREIHQGEVVTVEETSFDYAKGILSRSVLVDGVNKETRELKLPGIVQDGVSLQLYLRKGDFHIGSNKLYFYGDGNVEEAEYMVSEINEPVSLESGTYPNYYRIDYGKGNIIILIAKDTYRTPFDIRVVASFGKCDAKLFNIR
jgi:hypothetical protein